MTPIEETLSALTDLVREGKVRYLGCSNFGGWQVADADWTARTGGLERFVSVQNRYSLLDRTVEEEVVPACEQFGLGVLPYFPLEYGLLTGKYRRGAAAPAGSRAAAVAAPWLESADWDRIEALEKYAEQRGVPILDVAIAGLAAQPAVASVISGATRGARCEPTRPRSVGADRGRPRRAGRDHPGLSGRASAQAADGRAHLLRGQATCSDRFDRPIQKPSITWRPGSSGSVAAPRVTKSGV